MKPIVNMADAKKNVKTKEVLKNTLTLMSTEFKSFETLLKILPRGTRSKN
jgi:hypothetical protein